MSDCWPEDWPMSCVREVESAHERIATLERELAAAREELRVIADNGGKLWA